jgi:hypothetical protein
MSPAIILALVQLVVAALHEVLLRVDGTEAEDRRIARDARRKFNKDMDSQAKARREKRSNLGTR